MRASGWGGRGAGYLCVCVFMFLCVLAFVYGCVCGVWGRGRGLNPRIAIPIVQITSTPTAALHERTCRIGVPILTCAIAPIRRRWCEMGVNRDPPESSFQRREAAEHYLAVVYVIATTNASVDVIDGSLPKTLLQ